MGCSEGKRAADSGSADAGAADSGAAFDAGQPADWAPAELAAVLRLTSLDGGETFVPSTDATVEAGQRLTLWLPPLKDYRVRVFDGADKVLESDDQAQATDGGLDYQIALLAPLKRGKDYRVLIEAQLGPVITDAAGRRYLDSEWRLKIAGEPEPETPPKKAPKAPGKKPRRK